MDLNDKAQSIIRDVMNGRLGGRWETWVGYDVHYQLFDKRLYECVHRAARAILDRRDLAPLFAEMTAAARRVPTATGASPRHV